MPWTPFNDADPSAILAALYRDLDPEQVISLQFRCEARSVTENDDPWGLLQQVLSEPVVYEAFGISSLPLDLRFRSSFGLESIGTVANLLSRGGIHRDFVDDVDEALSLARAFLDTWFLGNYATARAFSKWGAWCDWFLGEGMLDETILVNHGSEWWLLAVTGTD